MREKKSNCATYVRTYARSLLPSFYLLVKVLNGIVTALYVRRICDGLCYFFRCPSIIHSYLFPTLSPVTFVPSILETHWRRRLSWMIWNCLSSSTDESGQVCSSSCSFSTHNYFFTLQVHSSYVHYIIRSEWKDGRAKNSLLLLLLLT